MAAPWPGALSSPEMGKTAKRARFSTGMARKDRAGRGELTRVEKEDEESLWTARVAERRTASSYKIRQEREREGEH